MIRIATLSLTALMLVGGCSLKAKLLGKKVPAVSDARTLDNENGATPGSNSARSNREVPDDEKEAPGERAQAAMATVAAVEKQCPDTQEPPETEEQCYAAIKTAEKAFARVGLDIELPEVKASRAIVYDAAKLKGVWSQYRQDEADAAYKQERAYEESIKDVGGELAILAAGRNNKPSGPLTSSNATDKDWIQYRMASYDFSKLDEIAKQCKANPASGELKWQKKRATNCELAKHRKKYYRQWVEAGVTAAILERTGDWNRAVSRLENTGKINVHNYEALSSNAALMKTAGNKATAIANATGVKVRAMKQLDRKLKPTRARFRRALKKWGTKSQWKRQAGKATRRDSGGKTALKRNLRDHGGLRLVKYGVYNAAWDVVLGPRSRPVERTKNTAVLARKRGEKFCRIFHVRIVQDHSGGGRYGKTKAYVGGFDEFYVSACR